MRRLRIGQRNHPEAAVKMLVYVHDVSDIPVEFLRDRHATRGLRVQALGADPLFPPVSPSDGIALQEGCAVDPESMAGGLCKTDQTSSTHTGVFPRDAGQDVLSSSHHSNNHHSGSDTSSMA